jgi:hypothetical protein
LIMSICDNCRNKDVCGVTMTGDFTIDECTGFEGEYRLLTKSQLVKDISKKVK